RKEELDLAQRLELARKRYRHSALLNWLVIRRVLETFEKVHNGDLAVDPTIDVVTSLGLSREKILARMPFNLKTLKSLVHKGEGDFRQLLRASTHTSRMRTQRNYLRRLQKSARLPDELSPRIDLLDRCTEEVLHETAKMSKV